MVLIVVVRDAAVYVVHVTAFAVIVVVVLMVPIARGIKGATNIGTVFISAFGPMTWQFYQH